MRGGLWNGLAIMSVVASVGVAAEWWRTAVIVNDQLTVQVGDGPCVAASMTPGRVVVAACRVPQVVTDNNLWCVEPERFVLHHWRFVNWLWSTKDEARRPPNYGGPAMWEPFFTDELWSGPAGGHAGFGLDVRPSAGVMSNPFAPTYPYRIVHVTVPFWFALAVAGVLPAVRVAAWIRHPPTPGHCRRCGYDLRATPDRCPECGAAAA